MKAVILAGGLGKRLRPFTKTIPKSLLPIGNKAILEIQLDHLSKYGFKEIFIATNYKSNFIRSFVGDFNTSNLKISISEEKKKLGTVGPIKLLERDLDEPFLVINGDILTLLNFKDFYKRSIEIDSNLVVGAKEIITPFQFGNVSIKNNYVIDVHEKPDIKMNILAGIYIMKPKIFDIIPKDNYFGMDQLITKMIRSHENVGSIVINDYWLDIGRIEDYEKAEEEFLNESKNNK